MQFSPAAGGLLLVELLHELEVLLVGVLDGLLQLQHPRLLLERGRRVPLEFDVAEHPAGGRALRAQDVRAYELLEAVQPRPNVVPHC